MAKDIFEANEDLDVIFKTSDGTPFYTEGNANTHAKSLKNKDVKKVTRGEVESSENLKKSVESKITFIEELTTINEVEEAIENEVFEKVLEVAYAKMEDLKQAE